jgi:hypothetical protein
MLFQAFFPVFMEIERQHCRFNPVKKATESIILDFQDTL